MNFILEFVKQGGFIGYILVAMNFIGFSACHRVQVFCP